MTSRYWDYTAHVYRQAFGRRPVIIVASFVFAVGSVIQGAAYSREALVVGRLIVGTGIGKWLIKLPVAYFRNIDELIIRYA